jgi:hypothetical protein
MEVVMSMGIAVLVCAAIMKTYTMASRRAFFASCSLAANAQAMSYLEKAIYAPWKPTIGLNNLLSMSSTNPSNLEMPVQDVNVYTCTNITTVTLVSATPPYYAMIRVDCVWNFMGLGTFTNTVAVLRGPDF